MQKETVKNRPPAKNLEGRRLQRLETSEPPGSRKRLPSTANESYTRTPE
jgi:hypothetical protein